MVSAAALIPSAQHLQRLPPQAVAGGEAVQNPLLSAANAVMEACLAVAVRIDHLSTWYCSAIFVKMLSLSIRLVGG